LYHFEGVSGEPSIELSNDHVQLVAERLGFKSIHQSRIHTGYTKGTSMLEYTYNSVFSVYMKPSLE
jgi:hypothetical protein